MAEPWRGLTGHIGRPSVCVSDIDVHKLAGDIGGDGCGIAAVSDLTGHDASCPAWPLGRPAVLCAIRSKSGFGVVQENGIDTGLLFHGLQCLDCLRPQCGDSDAFAGLSATAAKRSLAN